MRYKRDEAFRFQFREPLNGVLTFQLANELEFKKEVKIMDISPNGLKLLGPSNIPVNEESEKKVSFIINDKEIEISGVLVWNRHMGENSLYGFQGNDDQSTKQMIVTSLKEYSKKVYRELKRR